MPREVLGRSVLTDSYAKMIKNLQGDSSIAGSYIEDFIGKIYDNSGNLSETKLNDLLKHDPKYFIVLTETIFRAIGKGTSSPIPKSAPQQKITTFEKSFKSGTNEFLGYNQIVKKLNNLSPKNRAGEIGALKDSAFLLKQYLEKAKENSGVDIHQFLEKKLTEKLDGQINILIQTIELLEAKEKMLEKAKVNLENGITKNNPSKIGLNPIFGEVKKSDGSTEKQIVGYESLIQLYDEYKEKHKNDESFKNATHLQKLTQFLKEKNLLGLAESSMYAQLELEARYEDLKAATDGTFTLKDGGDILDGKGAQAYRLLNNSDSASLQKEVLSNKDHDSLKVQNKNAQNHLTNLLSYENLKTELIEYKNAYEKMIEAKGGEVKKVKDPEQALIYATKIKETQEKIEKLIGHSRINQGEFGRIVRKGSRADAHAFPIFSGHLKNIKSNALHVRVANAMVSSLVNKAREVSNLLVSNSTLQADLTEFMLAETRSMKIAEQETTALYSMYFEKDGKTDMGKIRNNAPYQGKDPKWCRAFLEFDKKMAELSELVASNSVNPDKDQFAPMISYLEENFSGSASSIRNKVEKLKAHIKGSAYADAKKVWTEILIELNDITALTPAERIDLAKKTFLDPHEEKLEKNSKADSVATYTGMKEVIRIREQASDKAARHLAYLEKDHEGIINKDIGNEAKQELRFKVARKTAAESIELIKNYQAVVDIQVKINSYRSECNTANLSRRKVLYEKMNAEMVKLITAKENLKDKLLTQFKASDRFVHDEGRIKVDPSGKFIEHDFGPEYAEVTKSKNQLLKNLDEKFKTAFLDYAAVTYEQAYLKQMEYLKSIADEEESKEHPFDTKGKDKRSGESKFNERLGKNLSFPYLSENNEITAKIGLNNAEPDPVVFINKLQNKLGFGTDNAVNQEVSTMALGPNGAMKKDKDTFKLMMEKMKELDKLKSKVNGIAKKYLGINTYRPQNELEETRKDLAFLEVEDSDQEMLDQIGKLEGEIQKLELELYSDHKVSHLKSVVPAVEVPLRDWGIVRTFANKSLGAKVGTSTLTQDGSFVGGQMGLAGKRWVLLLGGQGSIPRINSVDAITGNSSSGNTSNVTTGESQRQNSNFSLAANLRYFTNNGLFDYYNFSAGFSSSKTTVKGDAKTTSKTVATGTITINSTLPSGTVTLAAVPSFSVSFPGLPAAEVVTLTSGGLSVNLTGPGPHSVLLSSIFNPFPPPPTPGNPTQGVYQLTLSYLGQNSPAVTATVDRVSGSPATLVFSGQFGQLNVVQTATVNSTTQETTETTTYTGRATVEAGKKIKLDNKGSKVLIKGHVGTEAANSNTTVSTDTTVSGNTTTVSRTATTKALRALFGVTASMDYMDPVFKENMYIFLFGYQRAQEMLAAKTDFDFSDRFFGATGYEFALGNDKEFFLRLAISYDLILKTYNTNQEIGNTLRKHLWEASVTFGQLFGKTGKGFEATLFYRQNREYLKGSLGVDIAKIYHEVGLRASLLQIYEGVSVFLGASYSFTGEKKDNAFQGQVGVDYVW
jgi:hypothetical protein